MSTPVDGAWMPLREAAAATGLSVQTLRRRIKAGQLEARQVPTRYGPAHEVWIESPTRVATPHSPEQGAEDGYEQSRGKGLHPARVQGEQGDATTLVLAELVRELLHRNDALSAELADAREAIRALQAPAADPETATPHQTRVEGQQGADGAGVASDDPNRPQTAPRKAWWRFW